MEDTVTDRRDTVQPQPSSSAEAWLFPYGSNGLNESCWWLARQGGRYPCGIASRTCHKCLICHISHNCHMYHTCHSQQITSLCQGCFTDCGMTSVGATGMVGEAGVVSTARRRAERCMARGPPPSPLSPLVIVC